MSDILHAFPVRATPARLYSAVTTPAGLDAWWTLESAGTPAVGERYRFLFGPGSDWSGSVSRCTPVTEIEWLIDRADADWEGTRVGFRLQPKDAETLVEFQHAGWRDTNLHFRQSSHCWALYLRLLRRFVECGEVVPYRDRLRA